MSELTRAERSTVESIVDGVHRRNARRRQAARTGWALLATAAVAVPVVSAALSEAITLQTALTRIGVALALSLFVSAAVGSLFDAYQRQAAITTVERAVLEARAAVGEASAAVGATSEPSAGTDEVGTPAGADQ